LKRRSYIVIIVLAIFAVFVVREMNLHRKLAIGEAFVRGQGVTVWNSTAEVRVPVTTLDYGVPVQVLDREGDYAEIRNSSGVQGWVLSRLLLDPAVWKDAALLDEQTKLLPVQGHGETRVRTNFHSAPGRNTPVLLETPSGVPVIMLERKAAPLPAGQAKGAESASAKMEDWWLVRGETRDAGEIAGWILGRFISLDLPEALAGYSSSEGINVTGWYEINRAVDSTGGSKPEYLLVGTRGGEGQPCDFTLARVYTWSLTHSRYETAFIENDLCGSLPVDVTPARGPGGAGFFRFRNAGPAGPENREYGMKFTIVRRVGGKPSPRKARRR